MEESFVKNLLDNKSSSFSFLLRCAFKTEFHNPLPKIRIKLLCNWCSEKKIREDFLLMGNNDTGWNNIELVKEDETENIDYYVILNSTNSYFEKEKSIVFRMEPKMQNNTSWGDWKDLSGFVKVFDHLEEMNNLEWHLSHSYMNFMKGFENSPESPKEFEKKIHDPPNLTKTKILSTILSGKYKDPGQMKRIEFVKYIDYRENLELTRLSKQNQIQGDNIPESFPISIDVYGENKEYSHYCGSLPYRCKDEGLYPYKYTFNVENNSIKNYVTEKLIDGILSECLVFYSGCYNIREYIDERAYVYLELLNFERDYEIIKRAIQEDWYSQRLVYIREAKKKILNELQFFPRLEKFLKTLKT